MTKEEFIKFEERYKYLNQLDEKISSIEKDIKKLQNITDQNLDDALRKALYFIYIDSEELAGLRIYTKKLINILVANRKKILKNLYKEFAEA